MKLEEAIRIKECAGENFPNISQEDKDEADRLSIEALKGIKKLRRTLRPYVEVLLPGETEE